MIVRTFKPSSLVVITVCVLCLLYFADRYLNVEPEFDQLGLGYEAFNMGNYETAAELLEPLAVDGDQTAQSMMAYIEAFGLGRNINREKAANWLLNIEGFGERGSSECWIGKEWAEGWFGEVNLEESAYWASHADELRAGEFCLQLMETKGISGETVEAIAEIMRAD